MNEPERTRSTLTLISDLRARLRSDDGDIAVQVSALTYLLAEIAMRNTGYDKASAEMFCRQAIVPGLTDHLRTVAGLELARARRGTGTH